MDDENEKPDLEPAGPGVLGDGALRPGKANIAMLRRAIREDWPIDAATRRLVIEQLAIVATQAKSARNRIAAAKALIAADGVNVKREALDAAENRGDGSVNIQINGDVRITADERRSELARICAAALDRAGVVEGPGYPESHEEPSG